MSSTRPGFEISYNSELLSRLILCDRDRLRPFPTYEIWKVEKKKLQTSRKNLEFWNSVQFLPRFYNLL